MKLTFDEPPTVHSSSLRAYRWMFSLAGIVLARGTVWFVARAREQGDAARRLRALE
jgi:hypothetical protein